MAHRDAELIFDEPEYGELSQSAKDRIASAIDSAEILYPDMSKTKHRYYLVDRFIETNFKKDSKGGLPGHRYYDLADFELDTLDSLEVIADLLRSKTFQ